MIAFVDLEVLAQTVDPIGEHGDLEIGRTCIGCVQLILSHDFLLAFLS